MREFSRRLLIKTSVSVVAGMAFGQFLPPIEASMSTSSMTDGATGNTEVDQLITDTCKKNTNPQLCAENPNINIPPDAKSITIIAKPLNEEIIYRGIPSLGVSASEHTNAPKDVVIGKRKLKTTRREVIVGVLSSTIFASTSNRLDTKKFPKSQFAKGIGLFGVGREFGLLASAPANMVDNYRAIHKKDPPSTSVLRNKSNMTSLNSRFH